MLKEEAIWEKEILLSSLLLVLRKFRKFSPKKAWPISASNFAILWTVLAWEHISFTKRWVHSKWLRNIWMKFPLSHSGDLKLRERVLGRMRLGFCQTQTNWETVKTQGRSWMLPSLPILAGQGFIIRAAQKSTASRVAKDRKAFVLNISTWPRFPRQILWDACIPLTHQGPPSHLGGRRSLQHTELLTSLQDALFSGWSGCISLWIPKGERPALEECSGITARAERGNCDKALSFSDIHFFWSSVSYLCHLSTFLCFPRISLSVKWRDLMSCFLTVLPWMF